MFAWDIEAQTPLKVLCLGAHSDDIEIGAGGALLHLLDCNPNVTVYWVVFSANEVRAQEARISARHFLQDAAAQTVIVKEWRDGFFPYVGAEIKVFFEEIKQEFQPDLIFTHYRDDRHQDHRVISDLTWNTFRNHLILEYEIPKYDGDFGSPNLFVPLTEAIYRRKIEILLESFPTQAGKHWFDEETFLAVMRLRGMEAASSSHHAEGFYCRKLILQAR